MRAVDRAIDKVGHDIENLKFNTAIAELMSLANWLRDSASRMNDAEWNHARRIIVLLLAPIAPFLAEELWSRFGEPESVHRQRWPAPDPAALIPDPVTIPVQVNGRLRQVEVGPGHARGRGRHPGGTGPARVRARPWAGRPAAWVYVPGRMISLVRWQARPNAPIAPIKYVSGDATGACRTSISSEKRPQSLSSS